MRKIALYGKGGIGKSTTCANLCAALSKMNKKILQIGCDPKHDSCRTIMGEFIPTVLDVWREKSAIGEEVEESDILFTGFNGVSTIEAGGPLPGVGCAGRGVVKTMEILNELDIINDYYDYIFFDVLGDVVCGGFAKPMQVGFAEEIYIVTSGEFMSLYAANNIATAISNVSTECNVRLAGIILNSRNVQDEFELVDGFCKLINTRIVHNIPRDNEIGKYERNCKTVIEGNIDSNIANEYFKLADAVENNTEGRIPTPMTFDELRKLCEKYGE